MTRCSNLTRLSIPFLMLMGGAALAQPAATDPAAATSAPATSAAPATAADAAAPGAAAGAAQPGGEATPTLQTAAPPVEPAHEPMVRIRAGAGGAPAVFYPGVSYGAGFSGRIGVQLKKMWGVYADVGGGFGFGGSISAGTGGGGVSINVADYWRLAVMGEVDLGRYFFIALGPGLCGCTWGGIQQIATTQGASQAAYVSDGYDPALVSRIGVGFGKGRNKFTLALENMVAFGKMTQVSQNASANGSADQSVKIGNTVVGWAPGIFLGWDMR